MNKNVKVKAYVEGNLGDDLFIEMLCARYPKYNFIVCGWRRFKELYEKNKNLKYISFDTPLCRMKALLRRTMWKFIKKATGKTTRSPLETEAAVEEKWSKKCAFNVLITGSGFVNWPQELETLPKKYETQKLYYARHPYLLGCNFGPYAHNEYYEMYQKLFRDAADICFRDTYSANLFSMLPQVRHEADIVFGYPIQKIKEMEPLLTEPYMLISVANLKKDKDNAVAFYNDYVDFIRRIIIANCSARRHTVLVGFSCAQKDDVTAQEIVSDIREDAWVHTYMYPKTDSNDMLRLFCYADSVVATRYHAMVLGVAFGKAVCSICYNEKVDHVIDDLGHDLPRVHLHELQKFDVRRITERIFCLEEERLQILRESAERQFQELDKILM